MTVVSCSNNITFAGDGVQIQFDFNFKVFREEDLAAVVRDSLGVEKQLVAGTDFKLISGPEIESGGRVSYPLSGTPLQVGESITFYRDIAYSQELELVDNDPFSAGLLNEVFDRGVMRDQQLQEQIARSLKYDISTPVEEQLMPQEFMNTVINSRDAASMAESGAETAKAEAQVAQSAAEVARAGAEVAQIAAEYAKDQAEEIAWGDLASLRSDTPILVGPATAAEGEIVAISITDYVEDSVISYEIDVAGFGSAQRVGSVISWTLGSVDIDTPHLISVIRRKRGEIYSETAVHQVLVKYVLVGEGPTVVFSNDSAGWPGATIDGDGIHSPANSVGAINTKQIVSGEMEIEVASGEVTILAGTTNKLLKTSDKLTEGDMFIADTGSGCFGAVTEEGHVATDNLLPKMTGPTTSGFTFTASSAIALLPAWLAGDHNIANAGYHRWAAMSVTNEWLQIESDVPQTLSAIYIADVITSRGIKKWKLQGKLGAGAFEDLILYRTETRQRPIFTFIEYPCDVFKKCDTWRIVADTCWDATYLEIGEVKLAVADSFVYSAVIDLPKVPTKVFKKPLQGNIFALGVGKTGEYIGKEVRLLLHGKEVFNYPTPKFINSSGATRTLFNTNQKMTNGATISKFAWNSGDFDDGGYSLDIKMMITRRESDHSFTVLYIQTISTAGRSGNKYYFDNLITPFIIPETGDHYVAINAVGTAPYFGFVAQNAVEVLAGSITGVGNVTTTAMAGYAFACGWVELGESTTSTIVTESTEGTKDKQYVEGGFHNNLDCTLRDNSVVKATVASVSEEVVPTVNEVGTFDELRAKGWSVGTGTVDRNAAMRFPAASAILKSVKFHNSTAATLGFTLKLYSDNNGVPDALLYTGPTIATSNTNDIEFIFAEPQTLVVGTNYWVVLYHAYGSVNMSTVASTVEAPYMMARGTDIFKFTEDITARGMWKHSLGYAGADQVKTSASLTEALADVPISVTIPDRCTFTPSEIDVTLSGEVLKIKSDKVLLPKNVGLKQVAMAVRASGDICFTDGKIYIQETM